jgi:hypothetical protein
MQTLVDQREMDAGVAASVKQLQELLEMRNGTPIKSATPAGTRS